MTAPFHTLQVPTLQPARALSHTRAELLDRLAEIIANLSLANNELVDAVETGDDTRYETARLEIERLRFDCGTIKTHLAFHRVQHAAH